MHAFQAKHFPEAVHLSGYGNTLFGCCLEIDGRPGRPLDYYPFGNRLLLEVVDERGAPVDTGLPGRVRFTRLDESALIVRMKERDEAVALAAPGGAPEGFHLPGIRNPSSSRRLAPAMAVGLY
jgi:hypothetical protein